MARRAFRTTGINECTHSAEPLQEHNCKLYLTVIMTIIIIIYNMCTRAGEVIQMEGFQKKLVYQFPVLLYITEPEPIVTDPTNGVMLIHTIFSLISLTQRRYVLTSINN